MCGLVRVGTAVTALMTTASRMEGGGCSVSLHMHHTQANIHVTHAHTPAGTRCFIVNLKTARREGRVNGATKATG
jgi:hypothetical protein